MVVKLTLTLINIIASSYLPIVLQNILHGSDAILYPANESKKIKKN